MDIQNDIDTFFCVSEMFTSDNNLNSFVTLYKINGINDN